MKARTLSAILVAAALAAAGCSDSGGRSRPPPTQVTVVHAAPSYGSLDFLRVERGEATLTFLSSSLMTFDEDTYRFSFVQTERTSEVEPLVEFTETLSATSAYLMVLAEVGGAPELMVIPREQFDSQSASAEILVVHAAGAVAQVDVYVEAQGTDPAAATPLGTVGFLGDLPPATNDSGQHVVILTEAGNPANVLFTSETVELAAGRTTSLIIVDGTNEGLSDIIVIAAGDGSAILTPEGVGSALRVMNGAADGAARDIYVGDAFTAPLLPAVEHGVLSAAASTPSDLEAVISVTPVGNPSVVEVEAPAELFNNRLYTVVFTGEAGALSSIVTFDSFRPLLGSGQVKFYHAASGFGALQIYLTPPDTNIDLVFPTNTLSPNASGERGPFNPGDDYVIRVRDFESQTLVHGPTPFPIAELDVWSVFMLDNPDGTTVDLVIVDETL